LKDQVATYHRVRQPSSQKPQSLLDAMVVNEMLRTGFAWRDPAVKAQEERCGRAQACIRHYSAVMSTLLAAGLDPSRIASGKASGNALGNHGQIGPEVAAGLVLRRAAQRSNVHALGRAMAEVRDTGYAGTDIERLALTDSALQNLHAMVHWVETLDPRQAAERVGSALHAPGAPFSDEQKRSIAQAVSAVPRLEPLRSRVQALRDAIHTVLQRGSCTSEAIDALDSLSHTYRAVSHRSRYHIRKS